ncbi:MAG: hypothetical protein R3E01_33270 [Pirellulaceae bacterium]
MAAKIKGQRRYFGPWHDPQAALKRHLGERDDLLAGRKPSPRTPDGLTIEALCNQFLEFKFRLVEAGELSRRHHDDLRRAGEAVVAEFGRGRMVEDLRPDDFASLRAKMAKRWGVSSLKRELANIKQAFNWAYKIDLIDRPVKFGTTFSAPSQKAQRAARAEASHMIEAHELQKIIDTTTVSLRAMVLLAVNYVMGHGDTTMSGVYRQRISDERLDRVADHVRTWLYGEGIHE